MLIRYELYHNNIYKQQERLKSNIKLRVCVVKNMCGQEYVWTDQHTDKEKHLKMKFRVYSSWLTSFVSSTMLKFLCLSLFDDFYIFLTDRQIKKAIVEAPSRSLKSSWVSTTPKLHSKSNLGCYKTKEPGNIVHRKSTESKEIK